ncbi:hypothetical protein DFH09DRAFT_1439739 [Mycena vulgaris]|nr:hypothetical protein DFH09DRAFT_1439739 [Mycena vulgaris]
MHRFSRSAVGQRRGRLTSCEGRGARSVSGGARWGSGVDDSQTARGAARVQSAVVRGGAAAWTTHVLRGARRAFSQRWCAVGQRRGRLTSCEGRGARSVSGGARWGSGVDDSRAARGAACVRSAVVRGGAAAWTTHFLRGARCAFGQRWCAVGQRRGRLTNCEGRGARSVSGGAQWGSGVDDSRPARGAARVRSAVVRGGAAAWTTHVLRGARRAFGQRWCAVGQRRGRLTNCEGRGARSVSGGARWGSGVDDSQTARGAARVRSAVVRGGAAAWTTHVLRGARRAFGQRWCAVGQRRGRLTSCEGRGARSVSGGARWGSGVDDSQTARGAARVRSAVVRGGAAAWTTHVLQGAPRAFGQRWGSGVDDSRSARGAARVRSAVVRGGAAAWTTHFLRGAPRAFGQRWCAVGQRRGRLTSCEGRGARSVSGGVRWGSGVDDSQTARGAARVRSAVVRGGAAAWTTHFLRGARRAFGQRWCAVGQRRGRLTNCEGRGARSVSGGARWGSGVDDSRPARGAVRVRSAVVRGGAAAWTTHKLRGARRAFGQRWCAVGQRRGRLTNCEGRGARSVSGGARWGSGVDDSRPARGAARVRSAVVRGGAAAWTTHVLRGARRAFGQRWCAVGQRRGRHTSCEGRGARSVSGGVRWGSGVDDSQTARGAARVRSAVVRGGAAAWTTHKLRGARHAFGQRWCAVGQRRGRLTSCEGRGTRSVSGGARWGSGVDDTPPARGAARVRSAVVRGGAAAWTTHLLRGARRAFGQRWCAVGQRRGRLTSCEGRGTRSISGGARWGSGVDDSHPARGAVRVRSAVVAGLQQYT